MIHIKDLITIIVTVYNCKDYLVRCLESIVKQTYQNLEIIIVDDGSCDGSEIICDKYSEMDSRIRVFHLENKGVSVARNFGFEKANGKYVGFIDSDDWIDLNMYEKMHKSMIENDVQLVCCDYYLEYSSKKKETINNVHGIINNILTLNESYQYLIMPEYYGGYIWNKLYKKGLLDKLNLEHGLFDSEISVCEDLLFNSQYLSLSNKVYYLQIPYYHYFQNNKSVTKNRKFNEKVLSAKKAYAKILDIYKEVSYSNFDLVMYEYIKLILNLKFRIRYSRAKVNLDFNRKVFLRFLYKSKKINLKKKMYLIISLSFPYFTGCIKEKIYEMRAWKLKDKIL